MSGWEVRDAQSLLRFPLSHYANIVAVCMAFVFGVMIEFTAVNYLRYALAKKTHRLQKNDE